MAGTIVSVLSMVLEAEPAVVQVVHDLLAGTGGKTDQAVLTADLADWQAIIARAKAQIAQVPGSGAPAAPAPVPAPAASAANEAPAPAAGTTS